MNLLIHGRHGRDTTVLLSSVDGGIALSPKAKICGGGGGAHLAATGGGSGYRNGDVGIHSTNEGSATAAENESGNSQCGRSEYFLALRQKSRGMTDRGAPTTKSCGNMWLE